MLSKHQETRNAGTQHGKSKSKLKGQREPVDVLGLSRALSGAERTQSLGLTV